MIYNTVFISAVQQNGSVIHVSNLNVLKIFIKIKILLLLFFLVLGSKCKLSHLDWLNTPSGEKEGGMSWEIEVDIHTLLYIKYSIKYCIK